MKLRITFPNGTSVNVSRSPTGTWAFEREGRTVGCSSLEHGISLEYQVDAAQADYTEEVDAHADLMTVSDFKESVLCGAFYDDDGSGVLVRAGKASKISVHPSQVDDDFDFRGATHVAWYNK